jgi:hypothetical protein
MAKIFCCVRTEQMYGKHILPVLKNVYFALVEIEEM